MTVPADSAKDQVQTATTGLVDLRESGRWVGGSHMYDGGEQLVTGWHFHDVHEIEYACRGMVEVKTCLLYTSPSPRDGLLSRMPSSA